MKYNIPKYMLEFSEAGGISILDVLSVLSGFRKVCLTGLMETPETPKLRKQISDLKNLVGTNKSCAMIKYRKRRGNRTGFFVFQKSSRNRVKEFIKKHPDFPTDEQGSHDLGALLGYPAHCIKNSARNKIMVPLVPFLACSLDCALPWFREYLRLAREAGRTDYKCVAGLWYDAGLLKKLGFKYFDTVKLNYIGAWGEIRTIKQDRYRISL